MQPPINLRRFEPNDLDQVIYVNRACLPENYSDRFLMELHQRFPETFIVAEKGGQIVGYIICRIEGGFTGMSLNPFNIAKKGHVISIAVLPKLRRKGLGRALIREALQVMSTHYDVKSCYLEVRVSNTNAIELYKKVGFEVAKTIRGYYSDGEAALMMRRKF